MRSFRIKLVHILKKAHSNRNTCYTWKGLSCILVSNKIFNIVKMGSSFSKHLFTNLVYQI